MVATYRIDHSTSARAARHAFKQLFARRLLLRGLDGDTLSDTDPMRLSHTAGEGFGTAVQLHDGMTAEEAMLLLRAVLGLRVDTIETLGQSIKQIADRTQTRPKAG